MNIWAMDKDRALRHVLILLQEMYGLERLLLDETVVPHRQAVLLGDPRCRGLSAYIYTYGQEQNHFGLQLSFPTEGPGEPPAYRPLEALNLDRLLELISLHFELE